MVSGSLRVFLYSIGHKGCSGRCIQHYTEADGCTILIRVHCSAISRTHIFGKIIPTTAAPYTGRSGGSTGGIGLGLLRVCTVIIPHPFAHIAVHIIQPKRIGFKAAHCNGRLAVLTGTHGQISLRKVVLFDFIRVMAVIVCLFRAGRFCNIKWRCRSGTAGILPFSFGRQTVAIGAAIPCDTAAVHHVGGSKPLRCAAGIAVSHRIVPAYTFNRAFLSAEMGGIFPHNSGIFGLCHFMCLHIKIADGDCVLCFIAAAPRFILRAAHLKGSAVDFYKVIRHSGFR